MASDFILIDPAAYPNLDIYPPVAGPSAIYAAKLERAETAIKALVTEPRLVEQNDVVSPEPWDYVWPYVADKIKDTPRKCLLPLSQLLPSQSHGSSPRFWGRGQLFHETKCILSIHLVM